MRSLLVALCVLLHTVTFAQKPLPIGGVVRTYESVEALAKNEGTPGTISQTNTLVISTTALAAVDQGNSTTAVSFSTTQSLALSTFEAGKALVSHTIDFRFNKKFDGFYYTYFAQTGSFTQYPFRSNNISGEANERVSYPYFGTYHQGQRPNIVLNRIYQTYTAGQTIPAIGSVQSITLTFSCNLYGHVVTDDLNLSATKFIDVWGDSNAAGAGASTMDGMVSFLLRNYLQDKGLNYRLRNDWAISGSTTTHHVGFQKAGVYNREPPSVLLIWLGTNNAGNSFPTTTTVSDFTTLLNRALIQYPRCLIVVAAIPPRVNTTLEAANATHRAAIAGLLASAPYNTTYANRILYLPNIATAFTPTDATKFIADGLHFNDTGAGLIWTVGMKPTLDTWFINNPNFLTNNMGLWLLLFVPIRRRYRHR